MLLGLIGVWYDNFFGAADGRDPAVQPLPRRSSPPYLQQLDMESNGKSVDREGNPVEWQTGPIVWGSRARTASTRTTS